MKAITCTQCGATIENVSERSVIIDCEYCGARMIMDRGEPVVKPTPVTPPDLELDAEAGPTFSFMAVAIAVLALIPILIVVFAVIPKSGEKEDLEKKEISQLYKAVPASSPYSAWNIPANAEPSKPLPVVNYQPRVSWTGPNDMEYFDDPEVDVSSVSDLTSEEVEKTVFKNRVVKLKVVINTEGEIDTVETISGHPILVEAATGSAKRSIFKSRSKPTTRILTYTFRVLKD
jgi:DNA-directed RNA polymerase subunit RPC12/RpoP